MNRNNASMFPCGKVKYIPIDKCNCVDQGACLVVPVCLHGVCPESNILVIVEVFIKERLYSRKIKKIFTGRPKNDLEECFEKDKLIESLFVDNFKFYLIDRYDPECIKVKVSTQYIYNC